MLILRDLKSINNINLTKATNFIDDTKIVKKVAVMEDMRVQKWVQRNDVLLANLTRLSQITNLKSLIMQLSELKISCLILKRDNDKQTLSKACISIANKLKLPVYYLDPKNSYLQIMNSVYQLIYYNQETQNLFSLRLRSILTSNNTTKQDLLFLSSNLKNSIIDSDVQIYKISTPKVHMRLVNDIFQEFCASNNLLSSSFLLITKSLNQLFLIVFQQNSNSFIHIKKGIKKLLKDNRDMKEIKLYIASSSIHRSLDIHDAYYEVNLTSSIDTKYLKRANCITSFNEISPWSLIYQLYVNNLPIAIPVKNKTKISTELVKTLFMFFKNNESINQTAKVLFVHPNTVRYRLRKIKTLTGMNYKNIFDKINLLLFVISKQIQQIK